MSRRLAVVSAVAIGALALTGCSSPPTSGTVENKRYEASYTYFVQICIVYSSQGFCTGYMPFPMTEPEHWQLQLHNLTENKTGWRDVDPTTYRQYGPGDNYPRGGAS